jgi:hypothetical protein
MRRLRDSESYCGLTLLLNQLLGIYRFAVSSDDNSELWISRDSSPKNVELVAYVGDV